MPIHTNPRNPQRHIKRSSVLKFKNYTAAAKSVANGGIGTDPTTNPLLNYLKGFFEENIKKC